MFKYLAALLPLAFLFACGNDKVPNSNPVQSSNTVPADFTPDQTYQRSANESNEVLSESVVRKQKSSGKLIRQRVIKDSFPNEPKLETTIDPEAFRTLHKHNPVFDTSQFNSFALSFFTNLADSLNGSIYTAENSDSVISSVIDILTHNLEDGTDIVLIIDKTGSMEDDLDKVKESLELIFTYLEKYQNVKLGIATYGDKNWHYDLWYNMLPLSDDISKARDFLDTYKTIGNPDVPESVNDAIVKTVDEMNWTEGNRRLMLVIGDAPSLEPPYSEYSLEQVIQKCKEKEVTFNLFPVLIAFNPMVLKNPFVKTEFAKTFPNPAKDYIHAKFSDDGDYFYNIVDMTGKYVSGGSVSNRKSVIPVTNVPNGFYLIEIFNIDYSKFYSSKIIIAH